MVVPGVQKYTRQCTIRFAERISEIQNRNAVTTNWIVQQLEYYSTGTTEFRHSFINVAHNPVRTYINLY